jgi:hypothetical protein
MKSLNLQAVMIDLDGTIGDFEVALNERQGRQCSGLVSGSRVRNTGHFPSALDR